MDPFSYLGDFEIAPILELLDPIDIIRLQRVSRSWHSLLSSEYIARIALISHFPRTAEAVEFRDNLATENVVLSYRRAAYRFHTRRLGLPTNVHEVLLDCSDEDSIEWDAADGYAAWTSHEDRVLRIQSLTEGEGSKVLVRLDKCCLDDGTILPQDLDRVRLNVQMGKGLLVVTLNFYDNPEDGYGFGRRALILVFSIPEAKLLWKHPIRLPQRLLGEVDFAQDRLTYIRKTPRVVNSRPSVILHFVAHDILTGGILLETELERSSEISNGDQFFVMVTDRPFKRLIILHEDTDAQQTRWGSVFVRVFSISDGPPGKLLAKYDLKHSPILGHGFGEHAIIESDLYMDYPPKGEVFWVVESCFVFVDKRLSQVCNAPDHDTPDSLCTCNIDDLSHPPDYSDPDSEASVMPETVAFSAWCVQPTQSGFEMVLSVYRSNIDELRDFQRRFNIATDIPAVPPHHHFPTPVFGPAPGSMSGPYTLPPILPPPPPQPRAGAYRDRCQRFEIFLPEEQCSATFYNVKPPYEDVGEATWGMRRFRIDVGSYEPRGVGAGNERLMVQSGRRVLGGSLLTGKTGATGGGAFRVVDTQEGTVVEVWGEVHNEFLLGVQWSERHLALRTKWRREAGMQAGIVVFDFGSPW